MVVLTLFGLLFFQFSGYGAPPSATLEGVVRENYFFSSGMLGAFFLYLLLNPRPWAALAVGLALEVIVAHAKGLPPFRAFLGIGEGLGAVALGLMLWHSRERLARNLLTLSLVVPLFVLLSASFHTAVVRGTPLVYDVYAYAIDCLVGFSPTVLIGHAFYQSWWIYVLYPIYFWLPLHMITVQILSLRYPSRAYAQILLSCYLMGLGSLLYFVVPLVGVEKLFGVDFRWTWPAVPADLGVVPAPPEFTRNCMPSLHMAWILTVYWSGRAFGPRWRAWFLFLTVTTMLAAIYRGHYWIDMVVGASYALFVQGAVALRPRFWRMAAVAAGAGMTVVALLALRFAPVWLIEHGAVTLAAQVAILAVTFWLESRLYRLGA